jgi:hypothetical protein
MAKEIPMEPGVDQQTRMIVRFLCEREPKYMQQIEWASHPVARLADLLLFGALGRFFLSEGRKAAHDCDTAVRMLTKAIAVASSKKVMAKALFYRGNSLFGGAVDADSAIADYSLASWCDPSDCWARKDRATIYEMYRASYGKGDKYFSLPMTKQGACADAEAAILFFNAMADSHPHPEARELAANMAQQSKDVLHRLTQD